MSVASKGLRAVAMTLRRVSHALPVSWRLGFGEQLRSRRFLHEGFEVYDRYSTDAFFLSYPKSGRTWLRMLLGRALSQSRDLLSASPLDVDRFDRLDRTLPRVLFSHERLAGHANTIRWLAPGEIVVQPEPYRAARVVFLARDPRDVLVSAYFHRTRRDGTYEGAIERYVYESRGSLASILRYYNQWAALRDVPRDFLLIRYEDLHQQAEATLRKVFTLMGLGIDDEVLSEAVEFARFENMRRMEAQQAFDTNKLQPGSAVDDQSFKVRRGVVGGFRDYLAEPEIAYVNRQLADELDPFFGYTGD